MRAERVQAERIRRECASPDLRSTRAPATLRAIEFSGALIRLDKSNEITAIPELLRLLDLRAATVTIDAMGCQTEIAKAIVDGSGDYLLAVKDNQPTLHQDVAATFAEAADARVRTVDEQPRPRVTTFEETDKEHGRVEKRTVAHGRNDDVARWSLGLGGHRTSARAP